MVFWDTRDWVGVWTGVLVARLDGYRVVVFGSSRAGRWSRASMLCTQVDK